MVAPSRMSNEEFQDFVIKKFDEGEKTMTLLATQNRVNLLVLKRVEHDLSNNTVISRSAYDLAKKTAEDTASLVAFDKGAKRGAKALAEGAAGLDKARKVITPYAFLVACSVAIWHGLTGHGWPTWEDFSKIWR
jgi:hypothetical protein